jgi:hypothetical protein
VTEKPTKRFGSLSRRGNAALRGRAIRYDLIPDLETVVEQQAAARWVNGDPRQEGRSQLSEGRGQRPVDPLQWSENTMRSSDHSLDPNFFWQPLRDRPAFEHTKVEMVSWA